MKRSLTFLFVFVAAIGAASCGDALLQSRAPVLLVIDRLEGSPGNTNTQPFGNPLHSDVLTRVTSPAPCTPQDPCFTVFSDLGRATLRVIPKDITGPEPSTNNAVTINRYRVRYVRADGRNTPGVDVPYGFDGAATVTVPTGGETVDLLFELVRHVAKQEPPLASLVTDSAIITTLAEVTFYGRDQVGNDISVTGTVQVDFGNFGF